MVWRCPSCNLLNTAMFENCYTCMTDRPLNAVYTMDDDGDSGWETSDVYACTECTAGSMEFGGTCNVCGHKPNYVYWRDIAIDKAKDNGYMPSGYTNTDNLCCDLPDSQCCCSHKLTTGDLEEYLIDAFIDNDGPYDQDSVCGACRMVDTPDCVPLRKYFKSLSLQIIPPSIIECDDFIAKS